MPNSKNPCSFVFSKTAKQKTFKRGYKDFIARRYAFDPRSSSLLTIIIFRETKL